MSSTVLSAPASASASVPSPLPTTSGDRFRLVIAGATPLVWRNVGPRDESDPERTEFIHMPLQIEGGELPLDWRHKRTPVQLELGVDGGGGHGLTHEDAHRALDVRHAGNSMDLSTGRCDARFKIAMVSASINHRAFTATARILLPNGTSLSVTSEGITVKSKRHQPKTRCVDALAHVRSCEVCSAALQRQALVPVPPAAHKESHPTTMPSGCVLTSGQQPSHDASPIERPQPVEMDAAVQRDVRQASEMEVLLNGATTAVASALHPTSSARIAAKPSKKRKKFPPLTMSKQRKKEKHHQPHECESDSGSDSGSGSGNDSSSDSDSGSSEESDNNDQQGPSRKKRKNKH